MKKLLRYHFAQMYHRSMMIFMALYVLSIVVDAVLYQFGRPTFISYILSSGLMGGFVMVLMLQVTDFNGEQSLFIQTLPYERKTVLFSKWLFQLLMTMLVTLIIILGQIVTFKQSVLVELVTPFYDQGVSMGVAIFSVYIIFNLAIMLFAEIGQLVILMIKKMQRLTTKLLMIIPAIILFATYVAFYTLGIQFIADLLVLTVYLILGTFTFILIVKIMIYFIYLKIDIHGAGSQQIQIVSLYGGR